ncbi:MAG: MFS transporter [Deltaproteobacteria bacterium]|nr:MFS transporter [Deltaproteobacteria bacterium]MBM4318122.1 MFS transporter [Deltaproteobacteria bacterium]
MAIALVGITLFLVVGLYFRYNPLEHSRQFMFRRFVNWFPLGMSYAFLYMARYNLNVTKNALGPLMNKESFGIIFGAGTITYGLSFLINGPLVDKIGGKRGIIIATLGSSIANIIMGVVTYLLLNRRWPFDITITFALLYSLNMFFQSYGAVSIIKVKAYWFHVRERGIFGAIFGTLISFGVYFAFDWGQAIAEASKSGITNPTPFQTYFRQIFALEGKQTDATWLVFFIPATILLAWTLLDTWLIKDTPSQAKFEDFDTHDASSGEMDREYTMMETLKLVFKNPVLMMIAVVEFTTGVIRNGVMQWYFIFAKEVKQPGAEFFLHHWGLLLCVSGIIGGFAIGYASDHIFQSRRSPPVAISGALILVLSLVLCFTLFSSPLTVGICAVAICLLSISIHSLMSGTAAADFGGRKLTATASGITDGFVYLGTGLQSVSLGYLTGYSWLFWPVFLVPFAMLSIYIALKMWGHLPEATKKYIVTVERVTVENISVREYTKEKPS